jgi:hypothetical protein
MTPEEIAELVSVLQAHKEGAVTIPAEMCDKLIQTLTTLIKCEQ